MAPKNAARLLANLGGLLLLAVLALRGFSLAAAFGMLSVAPAPIAPAALFTGSFQAAPGGLVSFRQGFLEEGQTPGEAGLEWFTLDLASGQVRPGKAAAQPLVPFRLDGGRLYLQSVDAGPVAGSPPREPVTWAARAPDGKAIAFSAIRPTGRQSLYILLDNGQLDWLGEEERIDGLAWSPDGQNLAFLAPREAAPQVFRASVDGQEYHQLTQDGLQKANLTWSPDGQSIAYLASDRPFPSSEPGSIQVSTTGEGLLAGQTDLYLVDGQTGAPRRLTQDGQPKSALVWAGRWLGYAVTGEPGRSGTAFAQGSEALRLVDPQTGQTAQAYPSPRLAALTCPPDIPRGGSGEVRFQVQNTSPWPVAAPISLRTAGRAIPLVDTAPESPPVSGLLALLPAPVPITTALAEEVDLKPGETRELVWSIQPKPGHTTYISVTIRRPGLLPLSEQHCTTRNTFIGLPDLAFLPWTGLLAAAGLILCVPWLRHRRAGWLWAVWAATPVAIAALVGLEIALVTGTH